jgi:hypothetical protein
VVGDLGNQSVQLDLQREVLAIQPHRVRRAAVARQSAQSIHETDEQVIEGELERSEQELDLCWLLPASAFSGRRPVVMMESTKDRKGPDSGTLDVLLGLRRNRGSLTDPLVRAGRVEIAKRVRAEDMHEVALSESDDVIKALAPCTPKEAFAPRVHQGSPHRHPHDFDAGAFRHPIELGTELAVPITDDHVRTLTERRDVAELLSCPLLRWGCGRRRGRIGLRGCDGTWSCPQ